MRGFDTKRSPWPRARVFCCPFAGGSSLAYQRWLKFDPEVEVVALDYPGRLMRGREPLLRSIGELVPWLFEDIAARLDRPFSLVGASLGAIVAFELARFTEARGRAPVVVAVCSCAAPSRLRDRKKLAACDDARFAAGMIARYGGSIRAIVSDPDASSLFLPIMRADMATFESYDGSAAGPIAADVIAVRGEQDEAVSSEDLAAWREYSAGSTTLLSVRGDHFFVKNGPGELAPRLLERLWSSAG
jgi:surfactin synthase thioesterase subunit